MSDLLQRGRGLSTAERSGTAAAVRTSSRFNGAAVFRPRRAGLVELEFDVVWRFNGAAVFRPRRAVETVSLVALGAALQRGRGLSTAESRTADVILARPFGLQRGRGLSTAESATS